MVKKKKIKKKPTVKVNIPLEELLGAGCHFGHSVSKVNPRMQDYIFTSRKGIHIFDLVKTKEHLMEAGKFLAELVSKGGKIIFVGSKRQASEAIKKTAQEINMFYVSNRWVGGLLTNWSQIEKNLKKMVDLREELDKNEKEKSKFELNILKRELRHLEDLYGGIVGLKDLPQALFAVDVKRERTAIAEAKQLGIPVVAIVDTNGDPRDIDYVIPANDDAQGSVEYLLNKIGVMISKKQNGKEK